MLILLETDELGYTELNVWWVVGLISSNDATFEDICENFNKISSSKDDFF